MVPDRQWQCHGPQGISTNRRSSGGGMAVWEGCCHRFGVDPAVDHWLMVLSGCCISPPVGCQVLAGTSVDILISFSWVFALNFELGTLAVL